jgi:hypothetical protein
VNGVSPDVQAFAGQAFRTGSWRGELPPTTSFSLDGARDVRARAGPDEVLAALEPGEHTITARLHDAVADIAVPVG